MTREKIDVKSTAAINKRNGVENLMNNYKKFFN